MLTPGLSSTRSKAVASIRADCVSFTGVPNKTSALYVPCADILLTVLPIKSAASSCSLSKDKSEWSAG